LTINRFKNEVVYLKIKISYLIYLWNTNEITILGLVKLINNISYSKLFNVCHFFIVVEWTILELIFHWT